MAGLMSSLAVQQTRSASCVWSQHFNGPTPRPPHAPDASHVEQHQQPAPLLHGRSQPEASAAEGEPPEPLAAQPSAVAAAAPPVTARHMGGTLYERLKSMRSPLEQVQLDADEVFWAGDEDGDELEERRRHLQRLQEEDEMLERLKRAAQLATPRTARPPRASATVLPAFDSHHAGTALLTAHEPDLAADAAEQGLAYQRPRWQARLRATYRMRIQPAVAALMAHNDVQVVVILLILANCVTLALYQPLEPDHLGRNGALRSIGRGWREV